MPSIKAIGARLKSVTSTSKITKAMKMVAAAKLKRAETVMLAARPFASSTTALMKKHLAVDNDVESQANASADAPAKIKSELVLAISSDKGLCGGINSRVVKEVKLILDKKGDKEVELLVVGGKVRDGLARTHSDAFTKTFDEAYKVPVTFSLASYLAEQMLASSAENYTILFNEFKSVIAFEVKPLSFKGPEVLGESGVFDEFEFEGEKEQVLANLYQFNLACSLYGCLLENVTSENASRMTAMDSASNNAKDMINKLALQYNRLRQAKITTELTEIVAGAESV